MECLALGRESHQTRDKEGLREEAEPRGAREDWGRGEGGGLS